MDFQTLLGPVSVEDFFTNYWENRPLLLQLGRGELLASLLQVRDIEFLTGSLSSLDAKWIRLVNNRQSGPLREFQRHGQGLSIERIVEAYREGTTVVLNDLHQRWPPIRDLARRLWEDFNDVVQLPLRAVGVNAYLSPPNAEGLAVHFDSHCVVILQLSGEKTWTLYEAREELPSPDGRDPHARRGTPGNALHEVTLAPGDVVYIPRGLFHKAHTAGRHSLHLAVGLYPYTWGDVVADALRLIPECRRSLPRGALSDMTLPPGAQHALDAMMQAAVDEKTTAAALGQVRMEIEQVRERLQHRGFERCHGEQMFHRLLAS